jgi:hypothetical protein
MRIVGMSVTATEANHNFKSPAVNVDTSPTNEHIAPPTMFRDNLDR